MPVLVSCALVGRQGHPSQDRHLLTMAGSRAAATLGNSRPNRWGVVVRSRVLPHAGGSVGDRETSGRAAGALTGAASFQAEWRGLATALSRTMPAPGGSRHTSVEEIGRLAATLLPRRHTEEAPWCAFRGGVPNRADPGGRILGPARGASGAA